MIKIGQIYNSAALGGKLVVTWIRADETDFHMVRDDGFFFIAKELDSSFKLVAEYHTWQEAVNAKEFKEGGQNMSNEQDMLIWKLDKDLSRARLAIGKIGTIIDKIPFWDANIKEIDETLQEFFKDDKQ